VPYEPPLPRRTVATLDLSGPFPVVSVDAPDWLDAGTAPDVEQVLRRALRAAPPQLAVDLSRCVMADPCGLGVLVRARSAGASVGTEVFLVGVNRRVRRVLELLGLSGSLPVRSLDAARTR
jgi:anti-anti-sigma factor